MGLAECCECCELASLSGRIPIIVKTSECNIKVMVFELALKEFRNKVKFLFRPSFLTSIDQVIHYGCIVPIEIASHHLLLASTCQIFQ